MNPIKLDSQEPSEESAPSRSQSLQRLAETADYVSQRVLQLDEQVQEAEQTILRMSALTRQLRTLASNTTLEATRMKLGGPLAEIARQMRRISQQITESNDQLALTLRSYTVATGELRSAATSLVGDAKNARADVAAEEMGAAGMPMTTGRQAARARRAASLAQTDPADGNG
jgi:predicted  nucleic acid-binding Zn-ribbon protein